MALEELAAAFPAGRWRARWIWDVRADSSEAAEAVGVDSRRRVVAIRSTRRLSRVPAVVPARVSALSRYVLQVNGAEVARGPLRSAPHLHRWDVVDLGRHLREGDNELLVLAWRYLDPMAWWAPPPPLVSDVTNGAVAVEILLGDEVWATDATWDSTSLPTWTLSGGGGVSNRGRERLDPAALAAAAWQPAAERFAHAVGEPSRPHPPSLGVGPVGPRPVSWPEAVAVELAPHADGSWTSAEVLAGTVELTVDAAPGEVVTIQVAERLDAGGRPAPTEHDAGFDVVATGAPATVGTLDSYGLMGLTVTPATAVSAVRVVERRFPTGTAGAFACSDPLLERIWTAGRRTVSLCSADAYVDCPTREQRAWTGDAVVHQMVDLTTSEDWSLARWYPHLAATPRPDGMLPMAVAGDVQHYDFTVIPDWALHWVHAVHNLHRYVGDRDEIAALLPVVEGVVRWFLPWCDGDTGLLVDVPGWVIIDWAAVATDGASTALNGLWGRALLEFAEMAEWLGDAGRVGWAAAQHAALAKGAELLWDGRRGRYADVLRDGVLRPFASQHAQAAVVVGGLAPPSRHDRLAEVLASERLVHAAFSAPVGPVSPGSEAEVGGPVLRQGQPQPWWDADDGVVAAQPFFRYVVHDALAALDRADLVVAGCRDWAVLLDRCATSLSETWYGGTTCHGWSATPTRDLMTRLLGVTPAAPGFGVASVTPALADLEWARGRVPTPYGPIEVDVDRHRVAVSSPVPFVLGGEHRPAGTAEVRR